MEYVYRCQQACMTLFCCGQAGVGYDTGTAHYQSIQASKAMEQETLRKIVERTAENLIDVTGAGMERLPQADLAERTDEYQ
ncbi:hypothetical protein SYNPS1DRAFT_24560 [Syncephalis pseudoplumigaleata]|uniref:Uncharacterized protein n=1 Tax=Syncephalis pseudoplumigaleata TaxID=1712513 RepID=A0A4P9YU92_9FUNG|nr:hypothetical protein SYNPS1DRAFT_24560 [Syncephalis pseudoplumigaleata]|eukprot:RKP23384.1 hypothetical protein SYNPS1DRAFT_24560 [Syncephalis pseudoplumigaleata]